MSDPISRAWNEWIERQRSTVEAWWARLWGEPDPHAPAPDEGGPAPNPTTPGIAGSSAFLWKPVSESNGKVAVLTPCKYRWHGSDTEKGKAGAIVMTRVYIRGGDRDGETLSSYQPLKNGKPGVNGNRIHHRGKAAGEKYGKNFAVVADLGSGGTMSWGVRDGAKRQ
jgi:hypothetical protein